MSETRIDVADLKSEGADLIKDLAETLKTKTGADVETTSNEILVKSKDKPIPRTYVRVVLRKFLHKEGLREYFRVIGGKESILKIKEIKLEEEEEE